VEDVEQRLLDVLSPSLLAPRQLERRDPRQPQRLIRMRQRLLTLPVIVAIIVSLVWRRVPSIAEVQKVLTREGLLGVAPLRVSPQAITKRLDVLPAAVMGQLFVEVCTRLQAQAPPALPHPSWAPVRAHFPLLAIVDGSTLEALREKTAYRTVQVLSQGPYYRDEIIQVGQYRSNPCTHPLRMVSVLWQDTWYRYLTNVLDPQELSARQVCELYRRRWRIEDAFALT